MSVVIVQKCDRCKSERILSPGKSVLTGGWRSLPVLSAYGDKSPEQPTLCPICLTAVARFIDADVSSSS